MPNNNNNNNSKHTHLLSETAPGNCNSQTADSQGSRGDLLRGSGGSGGSGSSGGRGSVEATIWFYVRFRVRFRVGGSVKSRVEVGHSIGV